LANRHSFRGVVIVAGLASGARVLFPTTKLWALDAQFFNNLGHVSNNKSPFQVGTPRRRAVNGEWFSGLCMNIAQLAGL
jgi:hypothetical protein